MTHPYHFAGLLFASRVSQRLIPHIGNEKEKRYKQENPLGLPYGSSFGVGKGPERGAPLEKKVPIRTDGSDVQQLPWTGALKLNL